MNRRGHSAGGGHSSLGYLFGGDDDAPPTKPTHAAAVAEKHPPMEKVPRNPSVVAAPSPTKPTHAAPTHSMKHVPAGIHSSNANNYKRADGQNCGNFITDRPSTKVQAAPGGGSSLDYLFGGADKKG